MAFGLDSALHEDPRYFRSAGGSFWHRAGHAFRGTILTRTDHGTETFSIWRFGSAYGAAYLSNQWYPGRLNTVALGFAEGSLQLGFDLASNLTSEFWPDIKRMYSAANDGSARSVSAAACYRIGGDAPTACGFGPDPHRRR